MKTCTKCGEEKSLSEFGKNKSKKDGVGTWCKFCIKDASKKWRKENPEKSRASTKSYRNTNPKMVRATKRKYYENNSEMIKESVRSYQKANLTKIEEYRINYHNAFPLKRKAQDKVKTAIKNDSLKKNVCQVCCEPKTEAHHHSYEEEYWLSVIWLCRKHHLRLHAEERKGNFPPYLGD